MRFYLYFPLLVLLPVLILGCMMIADKDLITIAKVDGDSITRGDFYKVLRDMEDDERPIIRNKSDMLREINRYIDEQITVPLGLQMQEEGKINVPREVALEMYFEGKGDQAQELRYIYNFDLSAMKQSTELMQVYQLTPESIRARKDVIDLKVDVILEKMLAQQAVAYLAAQEARSGKLKVDEEVLQQEYDLRKGELKSFEWLSFRAFRFPTSMPNALDEAAAVRKRLNAGENWDVIENEYLQKNPNFVIESEIENNPSLARFRSFWEAASGSQPGATIGPIFLPEYQVTGTNAQGQPQPIIMPEAYLVLRVLETRPERQLTLEEAKPVLAPQILYAQEIKALREQHGVEVYEDKLPDSRAFGQKDSTLTF